MTTKRKWTKWSDEQIEKELRRVAKSYDRMPTEHELRLRGLYGLRTAIRRRGINYWAKKLGLKQKETWESRAP